MKRFSLAFAVVLVWPMIAVGQDDMAPAEPGASAGLAASYSDVQSSDSVVSPEQTVNQLGLGPAPAVTGNPEDVEPGNEGERATAAAAASEDPMDAPLAEREAAPASETAAPDENAAAVVAMEEPSPAAAPAAAPDTQADVPAATETGLADAQPAPDEPAGEDAEPAEMAAMDNDETAAAAPAAETEPEPMAQPDGTAAMADPAGEAAETAQDAQEVASADVAAPVSEAAAAQAPAATEPTPASLSNVDPNIAACRDTAGPANAGVPAGAEQAAQRRAALVAAIRPCTAAAEAEDAPADVVFLAAEIAQGKRDLARAFDLLNRSAEAGFGPAETRLGDYYLFGLAPGGEDVEAAIAHYQTASDLGDAPGMTTLALMYRVGKGVPRDATRMVELLSAASDKGYHFAQYRLAQTYLDGEGIPGRNDPALGIPDPARAAKLFTAAAEAGNVTAALELAGLYADPNSGVGENPAEQARLTLMASRAGLPQAVAAMGVLYETGHGVTKDPGVAALLYVKALESGKVTVDALRKGAPGDWDFDTAVAFQKILQDRGLYDGGLDGVVGPGTRAGARALAGN